MKIMKASPQVTLSAQLNEPDLKGLADDGVELVICNRPDDESADQASFSVIQQAAEALGMEAVSIAFKTGEMNHKHIESFSRLLNTGKKHMPIVEQATDLSAFMRHFMPAQADPKGKSQRCRKSSVSTSRNSSGLICWECQYE